MIIDLNMDHFINEYSNNIKEYNELKESYKELIKKYYNFLINLEIDNPIMLYEIFNIMNKNGMLSINENNQIQDDYLDIYGLYGVDILKGQSVCRHNASFLNDTAKEYGYDTRLLAAYLKSEKINKNNRLIKLAFKSKITPNHIINQIATNEKNYIFDPTNELILKKGNSNYIIEISGNKTKMLHTDKIQQILNWGVIGENKYNDIIMNKKMLLPPPTIEEVKEIYKKINKLFSAFSDTTKLFDFKINNQGLMKEVVMLGETIKTKKEKNKIKTLKK